MRRAAVVILIAALLALVSSSNGSAQAQTGDRTSSARSDFPNGIVFSLDATSDAGFDDVRLVYQVAPDGVRTTAVPDCSGGAVVGCTFQLAASRNNVVLPGAEVTYFWRLTVAGVTEETTPRTVIYDDSRFDWRTVSEGNLTVWWYQGSEEEARGVLAAGRESLDRISALLQTSVPFPVKILYYASAQDMQPAIISDATEGVVTLGEVVYSDTAMVSADSAPGDITRHEIAHIVVRQALLGPFGVPDWLNEGTAVFAQQQPLQGQRQALEGAIQSGRVFSVRSLSSASAGSLGSKVSLFYGQSWSLVQFLVDTYGEDRFAQLFQVFREGSSTASALEEVYGFNQDGLENAWRKSVGLPPRQAPTPVDRPDQGEPTASAPTPDKTNTGSDSVGGVSVGIIIAIAALTALLAGALVVIGVVLARRYR